MSDPNINGLTSQPLSQSDEKTYQQFNGVHSSQSSRSSSPMVKLGQLSLNRSIPQSQLPPSRSPLTNSILHPGSLNMQQNDSKSSKISISPLNTRNPSHFMSDIGVTPTSTVSNQMFHSEVPLKGNISSAVPNVKLPQKSPNLQSNKIGNINTNRSSQLDLNKKTNNRPGFQNPPTRVGPPPLLGNYFGEQNQDQLQFKTNYSMNYQNQVQSKEQIPHISQTQTLENSQKILLQTSQVSQSEPNQEPFAVSQVDIGSNSSKFPITSHISPSKPEIPLPNPQIPLPNPQIPLPNPQIAPSKHQIPPSMFNSQISNVQSNLSNLNISNSNTKVNSGFPPAIGAINSTMSSASANTATITQNVYSSQIKQQPVYPSPSIFQPNTMNTNFNGPPSGLSSVNQKPNVFSNRYPTTATSRPPTQYVTPQYPNNYQTQQIQQYSQSENFSKPYQQNNVQEQYPGSNIVHGGFNKLWGTENIDLLQIPNILPPTKVETPRIILGNDILDQANCSPDIFRCTMTKIPENNSLLQKSRLPLGVLIHPFKDLDHLPVIQCNVIVRCRACRTYINPFVLFVDNKRWKCNLCYRINELPEEFQFDPVTKTYGDPSRRPEIKSSTLEYIAPAEYMLRPPQPAVYLFLFDVSKLAIESGYLEIVSEILLGELNNLPGDARTQIGFVGYDSAIHFYSLPEGISQPHEMTVLDVDEVFLPTPDNLLVNLKDRKELVKDLLGQLPSKYSNTYDTNSALGAALQVAYKMIGATGGRVTVFQASLPNIGPGALKPREDPSQRATTEVTHLNPANDFYKKLALECSGQQIAVDLFIVNSQYVDIATISGISRFSGGCIHHFPLLRPTKPILCENFARCFRRYLTRKIGFEAVMRIRCTRGLSIHTFHGNFFVRSTDLLSLPNINPDAGFGMQVAIEESLADVQTVCFQAALLYTSSKGERRIRVHTMCLPVASTLHDIIHSADQQCIIALLSKMAVDRSMQSSLSDAREAFINVAIDILSSYKMSLNLGSPVSGLLVPNNLKLLPLYISAMLKYKAFRVGSSTRLDDRVMAMIDMKTKPLHSLMQQVYPDLYPVHELEKQQVILNSEEESIPLPPKLQLSARCLENKGAFLMDLGEYMIMLVCPNVSLEFLNETLGVSHYNAMPEEMSEIPILDNIRNQRLHQFINYLSEDKPFVPTVQIIRDNSTNRTVFFERLIEDRLENALSYHEFLQHLKTQVK